MPATKTRQKTAEELINLVEQKQHRAEMPEVRPGMTVAVHQRIVEKGKVRTQIFEGIVLKSVRRAKLGATITVRKIASGVGVERTILLHSPLIEKVEIKKRAKVRRAKLYYLRGLTGRAATQKEEQAEQTGALAQAPAAKNA